MAIMSFTLSDLPNADARRQAVSGMWNSGAETMVVIDRGTPAGFKVVADARQQLLMLGRRVIKNSQSVELQTDEVACEHQAPSSGSWVLAPCPHDQACPLHHSNNPKHFCHFSQRIERPKFLKDTKHSNKPEEDAKFSYVVIRRGRRPRTGTDAQSPTSLIAEGHDGPDEQGWMKHAIDWPRIILPPHKRKGHVIMDVCASSGV
ncbi:hypothetical protein CROQUDRAFT_662190 [Cronartium quercuum f. sp. fusiforme G11]|uniref:Methyltransferase n=1 Tax=Cronartium quercuum f. sp. fusiforme G11 TaxID=708437 RepID=A0A9P6NBP8_9BASI|nr:hypothetical protein CROQUDRAFT_662190 [Cronartium quercuum f. sp. fusiforme G11]